MININDQNEYYSFKNTSCSNTGGGSRFRKGPSGILRIFNIIIILIFVSFISDYIS